MIYWCFMYIQGFLFHISKNWQHFKCNYFVFLVTNSLIIIYLDLILLFFLFFKNLLVVFRLIVINIDLNLLSYISELIYKSYMRQLWYIHLITIKIWFSLIKFDFNSSILKICQIVMDDIWYTMKWLDCFVPGCHTLKEFVRWNW